MNNTTLLGLGALAWLLLSGKKASAQPASKPPPAKKPRPRPKPRPTAKQAASAKPPAALEPKDVIIIPKEPPPSPATIKWPSSSTATSIPGHRMPIPQFEVHREDGSAPQNEEAAMVVRERNPFDSSYWQAVAKPTSNDVKQAQALLPQWKQGSVWFFGPRTFLGRRQFRAVASGGKHVVTVLQPKPPFV